MFINWDFVQKHNIETTPLQPLILVHNVDGTLNENGMITEEAHVLLQIGSHQECTVSEKTLPLGHRSSLGYREKRGKTQCSVG